MDISFSDKNAISLRIFLLLLKLAEVDVADCVVLFFMEHASYLTINMYNAFSQMRIAK